MKVLLTAVPILDRVEGELQPIMMDKLRCNPPTGIYLLTSVLRNHGHEVGVLDLIAKGGIEKEKVSGEIADFDAVGVQANSLNWPSAKLLVEIINQSDTDIPIIVGGIHGTLHDKHILEHTPIDYVVRGEGEETLPELLRAMEGKVEIRSVKGLTYRRQNGSLGHNPDRDLLSPQQLTELPDPAWDLLPTGVYQSLSIESSRGCLFKCAFCSIPYQQNWRPLSAKDFVASIKRNSQYLDRVAAGVFTLVDDCYTLDASRVKEIDRLLESEAMPFEATIDARCSDVLDEEIGHCLERITNNILFGAECGYDKGLSRIRKGITTDMIVRSAQISQACGFAQRSTFSFVLGLPWEDYQDCMRTVKFAINLAARYDVNIYLQWHCLLPGSAIWRDAHSRGDIDIGMYDDFGYFQNEHLSQKSISLDSLEVCDVGKKVWSLSRLLFLNNPSGYMDRHEPQISFSVPEPVVQHLLREKFRTWIESQVEA